MTTLALNAAHCSFAFVGILFSAFEAAIAMAHAVRRENPAADDVKKLRAIADTL